jgi:hypothetical protein
MNPGDVPATKPTVLFVDDSHWHAFAQLSSRLRRHGVRTVRITTEVRTSSHITSSLLFDRHFVVPRSSVRHAVAATLSSEHVVDVQFVETVRDLVVDALDLMPPEVGDAITRRLSVMDKMAASAEFERWGIRVPASTPLRDATPESIVARYGLPVVVKGRVGCNGDGVLIVDDREALHDVSARLRDPAAYFYEQYVTGEKLNYAAAVGPDGIVQELTYRVTKWQQPVGSAAEVETIDDDALAAFGRRAVAAAGCTGLVNLDVIRDAEGHDWLIDFNPRAFGGLMSFLGAGLDLSEGYLCAIGERHAPPTTRAPVVGATVRVFPTCLAETDEGVGPLSTASAYSREARPYLRSLGLRYLVAEAGVTLYMAARRSWRRRFSRRHLGGLAPSHADGLVAEAEGLAHRGSGDSRPCGAAPGRKDRRRRCPPPGR